MRWSVFLFYPGVEKTSCSALSFLPSPSFYPLPLLLLPCRPPRAGPGRAGRGQAESFSPGGSLSFPAGSAAAVASRRSWSRSRIRSGCRSLAAPQDGPPSPHESY